MGNTTAEHSAALSTTESKMKPWTYEMKDRNAIVSVDGEFCFSIPYNPDAGLGMSERLAKMVCSDKNHVASLENSCSAQQNHIAELEETLAEVLSTGFNGGNNVRLSLIAASLQALDTEDLARAERSERAVTKARQLLKKHTGVTG